MTKLWSTRRTRRSVGAEIATAHSAIRGDVCDDPTPSRANSHRCILARNDSDCRRATEDDYHGRYPTLRYTAAVHQSRSADPARRTESQIERTNRRQAFGLARD